jgi:nucleoid-associated protein EbfC
MYTSCGVAGADAFDRARARAPSFASVAAMAMDMNKLFQQVGEMQQQMQQAQEELAKETVDASAGGGMVTVTANGAGEIQRVKIDPKAIDPDDPEMLEDLVLAAVNEAIRSAQSLAESKLGGLAGGALGGLGLPGLGT